jgi:proline dehydrogenase
MDRCVPAKVVHRLHGWQSHVVPASLALPICRSNNKRPLSQQIDSNSLQIQSRIQQREAHTRRTLSSAAVNVQGIDAPPADMSSFRPLASLPLSSLVRSYLITSISSVPLLLQPSLAAMSFLAHTKSPFLNPDRNPILHFFLKHTFYAQFCAGETPLEVRRTITDLKSIGFKGVILGHAKEVVLSKEEAESLASQPAAIDQAAVDAEEVELWRENTINTVDLTQKGDFVALKFSGAGRQSLRRLKATVACSPEFEEAVHDICRRAAQRGVGLLFDAEQVSLQEGIDNWTMFFAKRYNKEKAVVYGTYQAYARRTPSNLAQHLELARKEGFVLGVKLVRGAYLGSDPREMFWVTIEETHHCYNNLAKAVMQKRYQGLLQPVDGGSGEFPRVGLVLATHNAESVRLARELRDEQARSGEERIELAYGQLMGMADNVSGEVVQSATTRLESHSSSTNVDIPKAYKYLVWGQMGQCMKYLLRRAYENGDAVSRTVEARRALGRELGIRMAFWR